MSPSLIIAIDGPAGAGKSTVAQKLAQRLNLAYVDSGATYRAAALCVLAHGIPAEDEGRVVAAVEQSDIRFEGDGSHSKVFLNGEDVTARIRTPEVTLAAAQVSRILEVRKKLIAFQRTFASGRGVVMEGRDIGTVVFPDAPLKIFLDANSQERARRRLEQNHQNGGATSLEQTAYELGRRDQLDAERKISPLVPAPDATVIDSTRLDADQVVEKVLELARAKGLL